MLDGSRPEDGESMTFGSKEPFARRPTPLSLGPVLMAWPGTGHCQGEATLGTAES